MIRAMVRQAGRQAGRCSTSSQSSHHISCYVMSLDHPCAVSSIPHLIIIRINRLIEGTAGEVTR